MCMNNASEGVFCVVFCRSSENMVKLFTRLGANVSEIGSNVHRKLKQKEGGDTRDSMG